MNDSSYTAQLLYKLIKPSLHTVSLCERSKSQSQWQHKARAHARMHACTHARTHARKRTAPQPHSLLSNPDGRWGCEVANRSRRAADKCKRMTQPWSVWRLLAMIFRIRLICSVCSQCKLVWSSHSMCTQAVQSFIVSNSRENGVCFKTPLSISIFFFCIIPPKNQPRCTEVRGYIVSGGIWSNICFSLGRKGNHDSVEMQWIQIAKQKVIRTHVRCYDPESMLPRP